MARDDYRLSGAFRRVTVIRQKPVQEDVQEDVQQPVQENVREIERDEEYIAQLLGGEDQPSSPPVSGKLGEAEPVGSEPPTTQLRGGFVLKIDEQAGNWIKQVRDAGGGITMGPKDGIIAVPEGGPRPKGFMRDMLQPEEEPEPEQALYPKDLDELREMGRKVLDGEEEDDTEFEQAVEKAMKSIQGLLAKVDRSLRRRKDE